MNASAPRILHGIIAIYLLNHFTLYFSRMMFKFSARVVLITVDI